jgi:hypothetical protein
MQLLRMRKGANATSAHALTSLKGKVVYACVNKMGTNSCLSFLLLFLGSILM